ncbi:MAG: CRISPR-associated protein Cas4 [Candidatus Altiarchaeales archaeon HGW-Altiarchaeales-1]|nr:MAG: CRISPR-associated protein Cas4 [Candidatus Altiarchaeales archaeon HGW-Altiarchaeales-1]
MLPSNLYFTGTQINYYIVCPRKLWLFTKNIEMEHTSDLVYEGKLIHENSYERKEKEIQIGNIKIDFMEKGSGLVICEVKKSKKIEKAHFYQILYYLYYLKNLGINAKGTITYPLLRKREEISLTKENEEEISEILNKIKELLALKDPPLLEKKKICNKCSYYDFCFC